MKIYTKESLIAELKSIRNQGFIKNARHGNHGGIGNTLEDLLEIEENNLPIPNAAEWELKTQRIGSTALVTLFHIEPSPTAIKFVPSILLPHYGWKHKEAGNKYPATEKSFRATIHGLQASDRGFKVVIDNQQSKVLISFESALVAIKHSSWLNSVAGSIGTSQINPQPYWGFSDLSSKAGTKLHNAFFVQAEVKKENGDEFYHYKSILKLTGFNFNKFLLGLREGFVLVDFDARTGHNHGTKFRLRQNRLPDLYDHAEEI